MMGIVGVLTMGGVGALSLMVIMTSFSSRDGPPQLFVARHV